jgi:DNA-binding transcriptional LysR family regulator
VIEQTSEALFGLVRVTCIAPFATCHRSPLIGQFHQGHPQVRIELRLDDSVSDRVTRAYNVGIGVVQLNGSSLMARATAP